MALADDIHEELRGIFGSTLTVVDGRTIPDLSQVPFGNQGKRIRLHALFIDIRKSTSLVDTLGLVDSAKMYKAYLRGVARIVRDRGGELLSFNGDGIVAGFVGPNAANAAVLSGLNLNWLCNQEMKPLFDNVLAQLGSPLAFEWGIGIDAGEVLVVKGGMRGDENSDLVWAGTPVNHAVKISSQAVYPYTLYVSDEVYRNLAEPLRFHLFTNFFERHNWVEKQRALWRSNWWFGPGYVTTVPAALSTPLAATPSTLSGIPMARNAPPESPALRTLRDFMRRPGQGG